MQNPIVNFLNEHLPWQKISRAFIFGSIAKGNSNPNDCDLFIVTNLTPYDTEWKNFLSEIADIKDNFKLEFKLTLNTIINTDIEFEDGSAFKTRILNRPTIELDKQNFVARSRAAANRKLSKI